MAFETKALLKVLILAAKKCESVEDVVKILEETLAVEDARKPE